MKMKSERCVDDVRQLNQYHGSENIIGIHGAPYQRICRNAS